MAQQPDSFLGARDGKVSSFVGPDAVALFRARVLASALRLYGVAKILPTRGVSARAMLMHATALTGKTYKRGEYEIAALDVTKWADAMLSALPVEER